MCGIFGVWGREDAASLTYLGIYAQQHRGQESAGITATDGTELYTYKDLGYVRDVFTEKIMESLPGHAAIGHTRYMTYGDSRKVNAQPIEIRDTAHGSVAIAHNGNLTNAEPLKQGMLTEGATFVTTSDTETILLLYARSKKKDRAEAMIDALTQVEGAYSIIVLTPDEMMVARDPLGFRPLCIGRMKDSSRALVFASETCAFDLIDAEYIRDVKPGEIVLVNSQGTHSFCLPQQQKLSQCIFEHVYFARPDSFVFGESVNDVRTELGRRLAREHPADADIVVPVPDSGMCAAIGFHEASHIPLKMGLIRNHYIGRTFIQPSGRDFGVKIKLNPVRSILQGKRVVLVDDSLVRGTTSKKIVKMVRQAGAKEVHVRISCPPTIAPCFYGIDTPRKSELRAASQSVSEICGFIEADSLEYLSLEGLRSVVPQSASYCTACYTGAYPVPPPSIVLGRRKEDKEPSLN